MRQCGRFVTLVSQVCVAFGPERTFAVLLGAASRLHQSGY